MTAQMDSTLNLALALEGSARPASEEVSRLTGVAGMLGTLPDPEIDPRFIARLEAVLMAEFDAQAPKAAEARPALQLVGAPAPVRSEPQAEPTAEPKTAPNVIQLPRRRFVVRKMVAAAIAAATLSALPVLAASNALPGSPFFGITQFRQNHAISGAHGLHRGFVEEEIAAKWIGYGAEMVALDYPASDVNSVLQHAGWLQSQAVQIVGRFGGPADIAKLTSMLKRDVTQLQRIGGVASGAIKPIVQHAIQVATALSNSLTDPLGLPAMVAPVLPGTGPAPAAPKGSESNVAPAGPTSEVPEGPKVDKKPGGDTGGEHVTLPDPSKCEILFSQQLGDTLAPASVARCRIKNATGGH